MYNISVYYNNVDLSILPGVKIVNYNVSNMPSRTLSTSKLARANRSLLTSAEYSDKSVYIYGFVGGADAWTQQDNFDRLKANIQDVEGIIRVQQGTKIAEYTGTLNSINMDRNGPNISFTLEFKCADPIGRDVTVLSLVTPTVITTSTLSKSIVVEGSFTAEPRYTITINSVTAATTNTISLLNGATGKGIKITRHFSAGDTISITSDTMEVTVNTIIEDFAGQFPTFSPGNKTLQYIDDFTARNVTLAATYNRKYS